MDARHSRRVRLNEDTAEGSATAIVRAKALQTSLDQIDDDAAAEVLRVHAAANLRRVPIYEERGAELSAVPFFWAHALQGHPFLSTFITQRDIQILEYCTAVEVAEEADVASGYSISLQFGPNPYFTNRKLEKRVQFANGTTILNATTIEWNSEYDPARAFQAEGSGDADGEAETEDRVGSKRGREGASECSEVPVLLLMLLSVSSGAVSEDMDGEEAAEAHDTEAICEAVKDEIWTSPLKFYEAFISSTVDAEQAR